MTSGAGAVLSFASTAASDSPRPWARVDRAGGSAMRGRPSVMNLIRFGAPGGERPGVILDDGTRIDASGFGGDYDEAFFGGDGLSRLASWVERQGDRAPRVDAGTRLGPPACRPSK